MIIISYHIWKHINGKVMEIQMVWEPLSLICTFSNYTVIQLLYVKGSAKLGV